MTRDMLCFIQNSGKKVIKYILFLLGAGFLVYCTILKIERILMVGVPFEIRELSGVKLAYDFANGVNPYGEELLKGDFPVNTNMYGFLLPLIFSLFLRISYIVGWLSDLQVCEIVTLGIELIGTVTFFDAVYMKTKKSVISLVGTILYYSCFERLCAFGGAFPDSLGMTLSAILFNVISRDERKECYRPFIYVLIIICMFYTKAYFVLLALGVAVYLLSRRAMKETICYCVEGILCGLFSMFLVDYCFPLYFSMTLAIGRANVGTNDMEYSVQQIASLLNWYVCIPLSLLILVAIIIYGCVRKKKVCIEGVININIPSRKVLVSYEMVQAICILPFVIYMGQNHGAIYTYYHQLWFPYLIAVFTVSFSAYVDMGRVCELKNLKKLFNIGSFFIIILVIASINRVQNIKRWYMVDRLSDLQKDAWISTYQLLDEYSSKGEILVDPHLANFCLERGIPTPDYGQTNEVRYQPKYENDLSSILFPEAGEICQKNINYNSEIKDKIENGDYTIICLTNGISGISVEYIEDAQNYVLLTEVGLVTGTQNWHTYVFVRKNLE